MNKYLVINLGLRSIRAIIFSDDGKKIAMDWMPVKTQIQGDSVEQDPDEWWNLAKKVLRTVLKQCKGEEIQYVTVTSSASCLILLDSEGNATYPAIMVSDKRAQKYADIIQNDKILKKSLTSDNHLSVASYMMPKIMMIKAKMPEVFEKTKKFISSNDYLIHKLTGKFITDPLNAEKFYYNIEKRQYPEELLEYLGLTEKNFSEVKKVGYNVGNFSPPFIEEFDINPRAQVILTTYDALCAFWGSGAFEEGSACHVCGTCSSTRVHAKNPKLNKNTPILAQKFMELSMHTVGSSNNIEGGLLEWAKSSLYREQYETGGDDFVFSLMESEAKETNIGAQGLIFMPYLIGERSPMNDSSVRGAFLGIERNHTRKDMIRSIYESIGFLTRHMIEAIREQQIQVTELRASGGLMRNEAIAQIKADITNLPVHIMDEIETTGLGCVVLIKLTHEKEPQEKVNKIIKIKKTILPNEDAHKKYKYIYKIFKEAYKHNKDFFIKRQKILEVFNQNKKAKHTIENL